MSGTQHLIQGSVQEKPTQIARVVASAGSQQVIAAPGSGKRVRIVHLYQCIDATAAGADSETSLYDTVTGGGSTFWNFIAEAGRAPTISIPCSEPLSLPENAGLTATLTGAGTTFYITVVYYIENV